MKAWLEKVTKLDIDSILRSLKFVYSFTRKHYKYVIFYTLLSLVSVVTGFISSLVSKDLVDIVTGQKMGELLEYFLTMITVALISMALTQITNYFSLKISIAVNSDIRSTIFDRMMAADWEGLSKYHSGDLLSRINGDTANIASGVISFIPGIITSAAQFIGALAMVLWYDWTFAVFALLGMPFSLIISRKMVGKMQRNTLDSSRKGAENYAITQEVFSNIGFVKAFDMVRLYTERFRKSLQEYNDMRIDYNKMSIVSSIIINLAGLLVTYTSYGWGIFRVWSGVISYGTMTMFLGLSGTLSMSVNSLGNSFSIAISLDTAARRILEILDLKKDDFSHDSEALRLYDKCSSNDYSLHFQDASFHYEGSDDDVFKHVDLDMYKGCAYAIVGPSGDGKTTFLRCILSLVQLSGGEGYIECDGERINLSASTRRFFSLVPQKSTMFSGSVRDNLLAADSHATDEEMTEALKKACAWDFISERGGLDSEVLEGGNGFSSGQIQRIAIARSLLRKAPVLVLDEATSALDAETEKTVIKNIMQDKDTRLTVITTHRPGILRYCDEIYRFHNGLLERDEW